MPATSTAQRRLFAIAEHHPDQLYDKNKGLANLSHQTLHDFAATSEKHLPQYKADGHMASNTMFQQNEKVRGSQPAWMEKQRGVPHMADGGRPPNGHGPLPGPAYRVRQTKMTTVAPEPPRQRRVYGQPPPKQQSAALPGPPMMADGKKPEKWAAEAFKPSHKGMLHRALNVPEGEKIPAGKMSKALSSSSSHVRHMAQAAKNI